MALRRLRTFLEEALWKRLHVFFVSFILSFILIKVSVYKKGTNQKLQGLSICPRYAKNDKEKSVKFLV